MEQSEEWFTGRKYLNMPLPKEKKRKDFEMGTYDVGLICKNGHVVNASAKSSPELNVEHCKRCGAPTIRKCPKCGTDIQGYYQARGWVNTSGYSAPKFCHECGNPYPWTEEKMKAAKELTKEIDDLSEEERTLIEKSIDDIVKDTPRTKVATTKFKKIMSRAGSTVASELRELIVDIASETAIRILKGE